MPIPCYLALTAAEFANVYPMPEKIAWMACHFSCYGKGLSNLPDTLPEGAMVIVNDRTPPDRHDPRQIADQLIALAEELKPDGILLDFQRKDIALNREIAQLLPQVLPCPVAVTAEYVQSTQCAVFLEPPPLHLPPDEHIALWSGREIWLEVAPETRKYIVTAKGCALKDAENEPLPEPVFIEAAAFCRYHTELSDDAAIFTLQRGNDDLDALLSQATGITRAVGLYQQLGV